MDDSMTKRFKENVNSSSKTNSSYLIIVSELCISRYKVDYL